MCQQCTADSYSLPVGMYRNIFDPNMISLGPYFDETNYFSFDNGEVNVMLTDGFIKIGSHRSRFTTNN
ncbi:hypothetical protein Q5A_019000 [Serratia inhibens PRI-2C]|nr:hypothetical protein Q5A_019000 [Serratia inhibens PRI-2C]